MAGALNTMRVTKKNGDEIEYNYPLERYSDPSRKDGRKKPGAKKWQVAEMWDNHHEIARRLVLGQKGSDIAKDLGCSEVLISNVKNSPVVKDKLAIMHAARDAGTINLAREIADLAPLAVQKIREAIELGSVNGKECNASSILKECNGVLDREMGKAIQRVDTRGVYAHLTGEDLERIKQRAKELAPEAPVEENIYGD
jgi:hypothetical protein